MNRLSGLVLGWCLTAAVCSGRSALAQQPDTTAPDSPAVDPLPDPDQRQRSAPARSEPDGPIRAATAGPLHEAFLSPAKDGTPRKVSQPPPAPITERPGVDTNNPEAQWLKGYWEWDTERKDFVWVTGTWRVPPPGRIWVDGYWMRDVQGWYRVPGFWSDRKTDRTNFRKYGPPAEHPLDEPGPAPSPNDFYIPGQYYPDGDGVVWKPGYWGKSVPGWAWVPAQWVRRPEGWTFQDGYWDRILDDRGTLFAPATVDPAARSGNAVYQPYSQISPQSYGMLFGAYGRPTPYYDGYPGYFYDLNGRCYGYAGYGAIGNYYGYLDYPYYGSYGYPYYAQPVAVGYGCYPCYPCYNRPYRPFGYGLAVGLGVGLGIGLMSLAFNGFGNAYYYPAPWHPGWGGARVVNVSRNITINRSINVSRTRTITRSIDRTSRGLASAGHRGVLPPPSSRAYASPFRTTALAHHAGAATGPRAAARGLSGSSWNSGFNGVRSASIAHPAVAEARSMAINHAGGQAAFSEAGRRAAGTALHSGTTNAAPRVAHGAVGAAGARGGYVTPPAHVGGYHAAAAPVHLGGYHNAGALSGAAHLGAAGAHHMTMGTVLLHAARAGAHFR
jgi:hypothetical protein